jgi:hypothetical protein
VDVEESGLESLNSDDLVNLQSIDTDEAVFPLAGLLTMKRMNALMATISTNTYRRGKTWRESMVSWASHLVANGWQAAFMEPPGLFTTDNKPLWMFCMISSFAQEKVSQFQAHMVFVANAR